MNEEKEIECPAHLQNGKTSNVFSIRKKDSEYFAFMNNLDEGRTILITEKIFTEIKKHWQSDESINLLIGGGFVRNNDNVIISSNY